MRVTTTSWVAVSWPARHARGDRRRAAPQISTRRLPDEAAISAAPSVESRSIQPHTADSDPIGPAVPDLADAAVDSVAPADRSSG
jgi:hypothetical protein